jgi:hypothetical protein
MSKVPTSIKCKTRNKDYASQSHKKSHDQILGSCFRVHQVLITWKNWLFYAFIFKEINVEEGYRDTHNKMKSNMLMLMLMCEVLLCVASVFSSKEKLLKLGLGCPTPTPVPLEFVLIQRHKEWKQQGSTSTNVLVNQNFIHLIKKQIEAHSMIGNETKAPKHLSCQRGDQGEGETYLCHVYY